MVRLGLVKSVSHSVVVPVVVRGRRRVSGLVDQLTTRSLWDRLLVVSTKCSLVTYPFLSLFFVLFVPYLLVTNFILVPVFFFSLDPFFVVYSSFRDGSLIFGPLLSLFSHPPPPLNVHILSVRGKNGGKNLNIVISKYVSICHQFWSSRLSIVYTDTGRGRQSGFVVTSF